MVCLWSKAHVRGIAAAFVHHHHGVNTEHRSVWSVWRAKPLGHGMSPQGPLEMHWKRLMLDDSPLKRNLHSPSHVFSRGLVTCEWRSSFRSSCGSRNTETPESPANSMHSLVCHLQRQLASSAEMLHLCSPNPPKKTCHGSDESLVLLVCQNLLQSIEQLFTFGSHDGTSWQHASQEYT